MVFRHIWREVKIKSLLIRITKRNARKYLNGVSAEVNFLINPLSHNVRNLLPPPTTVINYRTQPAHLVVISTPITTPTLIIIPLPPRTKQPPSPFPSQSSCVSISATSFYTLKTTRKDDSWEHLPKKTMNILEFP